MAMGIGIGMGISGPSQHNATGWFAIDAACAFTLPAKPWTSGLSEVPYKTGDYVQTKIAGPYAGKRILLGAFSAENPGVVDFIGVEPGSLTYKACQI